MGRQVRYAPEVRDRAVRLVSAQRGEYGFGWATMLFDRVEVRVLGGDVTQVGTPVGAGSGPAAWGGCRSSRRSSPSYAAKFVSCAGRMRFCEKASAYFAQAECSTAEARR